MHDQESDGRPDDLTPTLVARLRATDSDARLLLDKLYRDKLVRFCWGYLGRMEEAEDAVQDICCKVLGATRVPDSFRPWLYQTARNCCLTLLRQRGTNREGVPMPPESQIQDLLTGHLTRLVQDEQRSRLSEMVANLPEEHQEVLRLRYVEDLNRAEISQVLEVSESVVKSRLFEGLKRLRTRVEDVDTSRFEP